MNSELNYCLLKGVEDLDKSFNGVKDVDILVLKKDYIKLELILTNFGFKKVISSWYKD